MEQLPILGSQEIKKTYRGKDVVVKIKKGKHEIKKFDN